MQMLRPEAGGASSPPEKGVRALNGGFLQRGWCGRGGGQQRGSLQQRHLQIPPEPGDQGQQQQW